MTVKLNKNQTSALQHLCRRIDQMERNSVYWVGRSYPEWHTWNTVHALRRRGIVGVNNMLVHVTAAGAEIGIEQGWLVRKAWDAAEERRANDG
jgi:hypothetical protein